MISLFRINDPYRLIFVFIILLGLRLPYLLQEAIFTLPQFHWVLIGERLSSGTFLYKELYDQIAPLSGLVYQISYWLFGRNILAYQLLSIVVVLWQAIIFNNFLLANKAYKEGTYIPAYCYVIVMSIHFDFMVLSPPLLALTFVLLAINNIFKRIDNTTKDEMFLETGFYLGIAALFYLPSVITFATLLVVLIIYSNSLLRRLLLMTVGFFLPILLTGSYYYLVDNLDGYISFFIASLWKYERVYHITSAKVLFFMVFPLLIGILGLAMIYWKGKFANFQLKFQQAMLFIFLGGLVTLLIVPELGVYTLVFLIPSLAFYVAHYLLLIKKKMQLEVINLVVLGVIFFTSYTSYEFASNNDQSYLLTKEDPIIVQDKKLLVLGDELHYYRNATSATPFMTWQVSKELFEKTDYYDNLFYILKGFQNDPPDLVIDRVGILEQLQQRIPFLKTKYIAVPNYDGLYRRINN